MSRAARILGLLLMAALVLIGMAGPDNLGGQSRLPRLKVLVGDQVLSAEVPMSMRERYRGLSGRPHLAADKAMLFFWTPPRTPGMHMKKMLIPLDFLWIRSGKVIGVTQGVPPAPRAPEIIMPPQPVDIVLEVAAGWARAQGVAPGTRVRLRRHPDTVRGGELTQILSHPDYQDDGVR